MYLRKISIIMRFFFMKRTKSLTRDERQFISMIDGNEKERNTFEKGA